MVSKEGTSVKVIGVELSRASLQVESSASVELASAFDSEMSEVTAEAFEVTEGVGTNGPLWQEQELCWW